MINDGPPLADDVPRLRVVRVHINDWVASTRGMSLDEEGFFWRFTCLYYDRMGDLPDDDQVVARAMNLDVRRYRHMKSIMLKLGKIAVAGEQLTQARALREINTYVAECRKRSEAAIEREKAKKVASSNAEIGTDFDPTSVPTSPRLRPDIGSKSPELRPDTDADLSKKTNEINDTYSTALAQGDQSPHAHARPKPKPKPISEVKNPHTPPKGGSDPLDLVFDQFWDAFPAGRKQAKGEARDAFRKIVLGKHRRGLRAKAETLISAARRYAASSPDPEYVPMPSTWLNGGRWEDDAAPASDPAPVEGKAWGWWRGKETTLRGLGDDRWRGAIDRAPPNGIWPWWILGAPPGHPECVVPEVIVAEKGWREVYRGGITHV